MGEQGGRKRIQQLTRTKAENRVRGLLFTGGSSKKSKGEEMAKKKGADSHLGKKRIIMGTWHGVLLKKRGKDGHSL